MEKRRARRGSPPPCREELRCVTCLGILGSLCSRAQAEKCKVIDKVEIGRHHTAAHSACFTGTGHNPVLALTRSSQFEPALGFTFV